MSSIMDWRTAPLMPQGVEHYTARYALLEHQQNLRLPLGAFPYPIISSCTCAEKFDVHSSI
jgi:hypothetical protein